jgi:hypothetical protein
MCVEGKPLATKLLSDFLENLRQFDQSAPGQRTINLEDIITANKDSFKTFCEADAVANSATNRTMGHIHYTVTVTAEGNLYVQESPMEFILTQHEVQGSPEQQDG